MANIKLNETTTLEALFGMVDSWSNLPASSLSPEQLSLMQFKNTVFNKVEADKAGGGIGGPGVYLCFICATGA